MSLWNDFWDFVEDTAEDIGDTVSDAWDSIKNNPIGAITSAVAMAYGIPPAWAGALGGAANAASTGGDVLKAAITGAAMGQMGYSANQFVGSSLSSTLGSTGAALAGGAAAGAAAGVTGAVLTGQNVADAAKAGLILGTVMAGGQQVYKLMTPTEAIASVPKDMIASSATSSDPLGDLIDKMGWTSSDSAVAAASKAFSQNAATTKQMLADSIPDYVLADAKAATKFGGDQNAYIADKMGWRVDSTTAAAAQQAFNEYNVASTPAKAPTPAPVAPPSAEELAQQNINKIANSAGITTTDAEVLSANGYTSNQVDTLIKAGYTGSDLVDLASTGVPANTLTTLSSTPIPEVKLTSMLEQGISANDIASMSNNIGGKFTVDSATKLLEAGVTTQNAGYTITALKAGGITADQALNMISKGATQYDVYNLEHMIRTGMVKADTALGLFDNGVKVSDIRNAAVNGTADSQWTKLNPVQPTVAGKPMTPSFDPVDIDMVNKYYKGSEAETLARWTGKDVQSAQSALDAYNKNPTDYTTQHNSYLEQQAQAQPPNTIKLNDGTFMDQQGNILDGSGKIIKTVSIPAKPTPIQPSAPSNLVDVGGGNYMDQYGNITDVNGNITQAAVVPSAPIDQTASGYTPEQEAQYNQLIKSGMSPADAVRQLEAGSVVSDMPKYEVGGQGATQEYPDKAVNEYRTPGTDLANQAQVNSGEAKFNLGANAWEVETPKIPEVVVTAPKPTPIDQPIIPIVTPINQQPPGQQPVPPSQTETKKEEPTGPTIISSTNYVGSDGATYRQDTLSDGTTNTTKISDPAPPEIPVEDRTGTVVEKPSDIKAEVLPGDQPPVTPPDQPYVPPIIPIVTPLDTTKPPPTLHGTYTLGEPIRPNIPETLNPGWITDVPQYYQPTNQAGSQYYWGGHPYQTGSTFDPQLYNQIPNAPVKPFGLGYAQTSATPQQISRAMTNFKTSFGPVAP